MQVKDLKKENKAKKKDQKTRDETVKRIVATNKKHEKEWTKRTLKDRKNEREKHSKEKRELEQR